MATKEQTQIELPMGRKNYITLLASIVILIIGFLLLAGGGSDDPEVFNYDQIFSVRRIVIAPLTLLAGFVLVIFAIMKRFK